MTEGQPYPDMTDQDILETILHHALTVMETDKQMGDDLWDIHKYLEGRLSERQKIPTNVGNDITPPSDCEIEENRINGMVSE